MFKDFDDVDFSKPVLLNKNNVKFWEISIVGLKTVIRCGILIDGVEEDTEYKAV